MGIKRYYFTQDNTITNAFKSDLITRGTGSNMGASDILEAFTIHGQTSASIDATNAEQSRILIEAPVTQMLSDIEEGIVPSASVEYRLKMFNAPHGDTVPREYQLDVAILTASWSEGTGLDMEEYTDIGSSNWLSGSIGNGWTAAGGDYNRLSAYSSSCYFSGGLENLDLDLSFAFDKWRVGTVSNYGLIIKNTDEVIAGDLGSYYTKRFFSRTSDFFLNRPYVEASWDSGREDARGNFVFSSSAATAADNLNTLYMYNEVRGGLKDIPNLQGNAQVVMVEFYSASSGAPTGSPLLVLGSDNSAAYSITGGILVENGTYVSGVYSGSLMMTGSLEKVCDVWFTGSGVNRREFFTGSFTPKSLSGHGVYYKDDFVTTIENLEPSYIYGRVPVLRVFARTKNWSPNIYTVATQNIVPTIIDEGYYRVFRTIDKFEIIPFGTGTYQQTKMSYDVSGNYFSLDTSYLEKGYSYGVQFLYKTGNDYQLQPEVFKFRIEEDDS
jgi:hypothetical protein